jgi:hypothetical protein
METRKTDLMVDPIATGTRIAVNPNILALNRAKISKRLDESVANWSSSKQLPIKPSALTGLLTPTLISAR